VEVEGGRILLDPSIDYDTMLVTRNPPNLTPPATNAQTELLNGIQTGSACQLPLCDGLPSNQSHGERVRVRYGVPFPAPPRPVTNATKSQGFLARHVGADSCQSYRQFAICESHGMVDYGTVYWG